MELTTTSRTLPALSALEIASGTIFGPRQDDRVRELPSESPGEPGDVLESLLLDALVRPPCLVAFSGGRDSSAILAAATQAARRQGLADPIPVTLRYQGHPLTAESDWQELTVRHLGLREWIVLDLHWELEALGEIATGVLLRHGLYWPANAHAMVPLLQAASPGSLVTGNGGDEVLSPWPLRAIALMRSGRWRPRSARELKYLALSLLPTALRTAVWRRRSTVRLAWLTPGAQHELQRLWASKLAVQPPAWRDSLALLLNSRYLEVALGAFETMAAEAHVALVQPFLDPSYMAAVAASAPREGHRSRTSAMEAHFGDLLPPEVRRRTTKARFSEILVGPIARRFVDEWSGAGIDPQLVDPAELRREWSREVPDLRSLTLLQAAWLADRGGSNGRAIERPRSNWPKTVRFLLDGSPD